MNIPFQVNFPKPGGSVQGSFFVAFGVSDCSPDDVVAFLYDPTDPKGKNSQMGRACPADLRIPLWAAAFFNVPKGDNYVIELHHKRGSKQVGRVTGFRVTAGKKKYTTGPQIYYPTSSPVPMTFTAYGPTDDLTDAVVATMKRESDGTTVTGTNTFTPSASYPYWMAEFDLSGYAPGDAWDLKVVQGTYAVPENGLTVSS